MAGGIDRALVEVKSGRGIRGMGANGNGIIKKKIKAKGTWELRGEKGELITPPPQVPRAL